MSVELFEKIGLPASEATKLAKNAALTGSLERLVDAAGVRNGCDATIGKLLYALAAKLTKAVPQAAADLLAKYVGEGKIDKIRINAAIALALSHDYDAGGPLTAAIIDKECGVGVVVTAAQIADAVKRGIDGPIKDELLELRYHFNIGECCNRTRQKKNNSLFFFFFFFFLH
jgi:glutaminyl-tRNA synthetase